MVVVVQLFYGAVSLQSSELGSNSNKQKNIDNNERAPDHRRRAEEAQYCLDQHRKSQK